MTGKLFQLSQVFSAYGYEPKDGTVISSNNPTIVTGSKNRIYYRRPTPDVDTNNKVSYYFLFYFLPLLLINLIEFIFLVGNIFVYCK